MKCRYTLLLTGERPALKQDFPSSEDPAVGRSARSPERKSQVTSGRLQLAFFKHSLEHSPPPGCPRALLRSQPNVLLCSSPQSCSRITRISQTYTGDARQVFGHVRGPSLCAAIASESGLIGVIKAEQPKDASKNSPDDTILWLLAKVLAARVAAQKAKAQLQQKQVQEEMLLRALQGAGEAIREWLAMEIHDSVSQTLVAALRYFQMWKQKAGSDSAMRSHDLLARVEYLMHKALDQAREVTSGTLPSLPEGRSLRAAISEHISLLASQGCQVKLQIPALAIPPEVEAGLARIVSEALHNILKHAQARRALVSVSVKEAKLRAQVRDWGQGFDSRAWAASRPPGTGLLSMRRRAERLGGTFRLVSRPGWGTSIIVTIPLGTRSV